MKALTEEKFLTDSELTHLLALLEKHKGTRDSILLRLLLFTGARGVEIRRVRKCHIGNKSVAIQGAKGSNDRVIALSPSFFKELQEYVVNMGDDDVIFPVAERTLRHIWHQFRLNPRKGVHALRHTFGVRLCDNSGGNVHAVKSALGHRNIQNTMVYLDYVQGQKQLRQAMKGMWNGKLCDVA